MYVHVLVKALAITSSMPTSADPSVIQRLLPKQTPFLADRVCDLRDAGSVEIDCSAIIPIQGELRQ